MTLKRSSPLVLSLGRGPAGGWGATTAWNLLQLQQSLITRLVSLQRRSAHWTSRTFAIVSPTPPCKVVAWAYWTTLRVYRAESENGVPVFWSGAVETGLLFCQYVFPFIKWCHAMTLEASVRGLIAVHARTCLLLCITSPRYLITSPVWRFISMIFTWFYWTSMYPGAQCITKFDKIPVLPIVVVAYQISANPS